MARKCIKKMKIRLILPICNSDYLGKWYYCEDSFLKKRERLKILENAMLYKNNIDLVATSNNFFGFADNHEIRLKNLLNMLKNKKDLIIGVDFPDRKNPYGGIPSKVFYLKKYNGLYIIKKSIWEVYPCKKNKPLERFKKQNRIINIKNKSITLLSCGDIK